MLDNLKLYGGGDCPESTLKGIRTALKYALPKSYVYVFTDATAKDFGLDVDVLSLIQRRQATVKRRNSFQRKALDRFLFVCLFLNTKIVDVPFDRFL